MKKHAHLFCFGRRFTSSTLVRTFEYRTKKSGEETKVSHLESPEGDLASGVRAPMSYRAVTHMGPRTGTDGLCRHGYF